MFAQSHVGACQVRAAVLLFFFFRGTKEQTTIKDMRTGGQSAGTVACTSNTSVSKVTCVVYTVLPSTAAAIVAAAAPAATPACSVGYKSLDTSPARV